MDAGQEAHDAGSYKHAVVQKISTAPILPASTVWVGVTDPSSLLRVDLDEHRSVVGCNTRAVSLLGHNGHADLIAADFTSDLVSPQGREAVEVLIARALSGQATQHVGVQLVDKQHRLVSVVVDFLPETSERGVKGGLVVQESRPCMDINRLTDNLGDVMAWVTQRNGKVVACSSLGAEELGYKHRDAVVGKSLLKDILQPECREHAEELLEEVVMGQHFEDIASKMYKKDRSEMCVTLDVGPVREWGGDLDLGVALDVHPVDWWDGDGALWVGQFNSNNDTSQNDDQNKLNQAPKTQNNVAYFVSQ